MTVRKQWHQDLRPPVPEPFDNVMVALVVVAEWVKREPDATAAKLTCPTCANVLLVSRASNGHVWARCTTEGCHVFHAAFKKD